MIGHKNSSESIERSKLSVVAQFDDMYRFANSLIFVDENGNQMINELI